MRPLDRYYPFLLGLGLTPFPAQSCLPGNMAGLTGSYFPIVLLPVLSAVHLLTAHSYQALFATGTGQERETSQAPSKTDPLPILLGDRGSPWRSARSP